MPDKHGQRLRLWDRVTVYCPDTTCHHHQYHQQVGAVVRLVPGWDIEVQFEDRALGNHLFSGDELIRLEAQQR